MSEVENLEVVETPQVIDSAAFEAEMLAEAEQKANDPAEQAAQIFKAYQRSFEKSIERLPKQALYRLVKALVLAPLEKVSLEHENEHEAYFYANSMIEAKTVMQLSVMQNSMEETFQAYEELQKEVTTDVIYGEEAKNANT